VTGLRRQLTAPAPLLAVLLLAFTLVLVVVELRWGPVHRLDRRIADDLHRVALDHPAQVTWWKWVSRVLHPYVLRIASAIAAAALWLRGRRRTAVFVLVTIAGAALLETLTKALVDRARPVFAEPVAHASGASFPSGHAMTSMVAFGLLVLLVPAHRRLAAAVGAIAVVLVGFSRLALGVHYLTDVVGGWLLGAACLVAAEWMVRRR
jgi:membrane-associated phospholipid phosphatase